MFKKAICAIVLTATLFLSGCTPLLYTPEFEEDMSKQYLAEAETWMLENIDGATNLTYELYTNKYVSSIVKGQFEISDIVYNYAFDVDSDKLYANTNKHGVTSSDVVSILDECLSEYYADTNIEISRVDVSWQIPCNLYYDKSSVDSETDEVASEVIQSDELPFLKRSTGIAILIY